jgi:hypothetical protein
MIHTFYPHVKDFLKSGHDLVGDETVGMQTTQVTEAASLMRSGARGKFLMVNESELLHKLRYLSKSQIRLIGSDQKVRGKDL